MKENRGYRVVPLSRGRRRVAATLHVAGERYIMHAITEADITEPRRLIREYSERTGESLSLTAYVVAYLARAVKIMKTKERDHGKVRPGSPARRLPARSARAVRTSTRRNRRPPEDKQPSVEVPELERREACSRAP